MLDFLRKNATGPLGIILIILLVFAFSIWGVGDIFRGYNSNILAQVGDREVNAQNFLFRFNREINRVSNDMSRMISTEEAKSAGLHYQVLNRVIVETSINASGDKMDLLASEEALKKRILSTNAFKNAFNQFDKNIFDQVLRQNGLTEDIYLSIEQDFHVQEQLSKSVFMNINPPSVLNDLLYAYQFERREIDYIIISPQSDINTSEISDESSLDYYNKNKNRYQTNETRDFSFISLIINDVSSQFDVNEQEIINFYEDNKYDYFEPEKRSYNLIPYTSEVDALNALEDYKSNNNFERLLEVRGLEASDVDQGLITAEEGITDEISKNAFRSNLNELTGPVDSPFGPSLIYVKEIINEKETLLEDVKDEVLSTIQKEMAQDKIYQLYSEIEDARASGKTFEEIALENNLPIQNLTSISIVGKKDDGSYIDTPLRDIIIENVFGNEIDLEIDPLEDEDGNIAFIRVDNINSPKQIPYVEISDNIKMTISENQSIAKMEVKAQEIFNNLKSDNNNLEYIADRNNIAIAKSGLLTRSSTNEIFSTQALNEIFKTEKGSSFISNVGIGSSKIIGIIKDTSLLDRSEERINSINIVNKQRLENDLAYSLAEEHQKELSSEIFPERMEALFETQESEGSF
jgi:peptidyl-prolyl cis-trans isomerase D|tara:strand:+ start:7979 stop:9880 length:1902 start_codon:yes stop_codon:yes gene_type:complete